MILHLNSSSHPCPKWCIYTILERLRKFNSIWYGPKEVGKQAQPKSPPENVELFYFSHLLRPCTGYKITRHGCPHVAQTKLVDIRKSYVF